jgi:alpha-amylase
VSTARVTVSSVFIEGLVLYRYWPTDIYTLNTNFGSVDDLKALASALHSRQMYLMIDVVVNHVASPVFPVTSFNNFVPLNQQSDFHTQCWIVDYNNQTEVEQCWLGDQNVALVDVNTEDNGIVTTLYDWVKGLAGNYSADGLRIDTVKHVRKDFWPDFASSAGVYTIGEVLHNETSYVSNYTRRWNLYLPLIKLLTARAEVLDAVLDYPTWYTLVAGFQTQYGNLSALAEQVTTAQSTYKNGLFGTGSFLENHDQPRFQSLTTDPGVCYRFMLRP